MAARRKSQTTESNQPLRGAAAISRRKAIEATLAIIAMAAGGNAFASAWSSQLSFDSSHCASAASVGRTAWCDCMSSELQGALNSADQRSTGYSILFGSSVQNNINLGYRSCLSGTTWPGSFWHF
jgi:hypothetical protein